MKFYLTTIQYNKEKDAENRTAPKVFDSLEKAEAEFYSQVGQDMKNATLGGSVNMVFNSEGGVYPSLNKKWGIMEAPQPEPEPEEAIEE